MSKEEKEQLFGRLIEKLDNTAEYENLLILMECYDNLESQLDITNKKLNKIKELVNKYGYYTLSEIPELLSIIGGNNE